MTSNIFLGKEKHTYAIVSRLPQLDAALRGGLLKKLVGDLEEDAHTVAGLALGVLSGPVLQLFHDFQGVVHRPVALPALDIHHGADSTGVMLKGGIIQALLSISLVSDHFHLYKPLSG